MKPSKKSESKNRSVKCILDFYRNLSDKEKVLISMFDWFCTACENGRDDQRLREIVDNFNIKNLPKKYQQVATWKTLCETLA